MASTMQASVRRMADLIDNVMDLARGRLGGGLGVRRAQTNLAPLLDHVVAELRTAWPTHSIEADFAVADPVFRDSTRIGQLFSNLLGNALTHGAPEGVVRAKAATTSKGFELSVSNTGAELPAPALSRLFRPFVRGEATHRQQGQGLGLGLYIASEIAKAHGGTLDAASSPDETRFTFKMLLGR